jgi:hypothetical protein
MGIAGNSRDSKWTFWSVWMKTHYKTLPKVLSKIQDKAFSVAGLIDSAKYYLKTALGFAESQPVALANGKKYVPIKTGGSDPTIPVNWMEDGELNITLVSSTTDIVENRLRMLGYNFDPQFCFGVSQLVALATGLVFKLKMSSTLYGGLTRGAYGIVNTLSFTSLYTQMVVFLENTGGGIIVHFDASTELEIFDADNDIVYDIAIAIDVDNDSGFIYIDGKLVYILYGVDDANGALLVAGTQPSDIPSYKKLAIPERLRPELVQYDFFNAFDNVDGSGAIGGTTEDPTTVAGFQIMDVGGGDMRMTGTTTPPSTAVINACILDNPIRGGVVVVVDHRFILDNNFESQEVRVVNGNGDTIVAYYCINVFGTFLLIVKDANGDDVGNVYSIVGSMPDGRVIFTVDLEAQTASLFFRELASNNLDLDISGGFPSDAVVTGVDFFLGKGSAGDTLTEWFDNLTVYQRDRGV